MPPRFKPYGNLDTERLVYLDFRLNEKILSQSLRLEKRSRDLVAAVMANTHAYTGAASENTGCTGCDRHRSRVT